jgi:glycosyl transferase family 25
MLKVFVINLQDSVERRKRVSDRLNELHINFEVFPAIDGRKEPHPLFERYDAKRCGNYRRRAQMSGGELGCFASHFSLWSKCIELNEPILILEDDLIIADSVIEAIELVERNIETLGLLRLSGISLHRRPHKRVCKLGSFDLVDHIRGPAGTQAYALAPEAARKLVDSAQTWFVPVDDYIDRYWGHGVDSLSLMPFPICLADMDSDIPRANTPKKNLWLRLKHEYFGRLERIRRTIYRLINKKRVPVERLQGSA